MSKINFPGKNKRTKRSLLLTIGGCLALLAGLSGVVDGTLLLASGKTISAFLNQQDLGIVSINTIPNSNLISGILSIMYGLAAILGGVYALSRKHFPRALLLGGLVAFIADTGFYYNSIFKKCL
ncbi:MAG: hypothetical protein NTV30_09990 [Chloroflexi bacterium]|nr:hypothetical protein [Chloroflexota bacterium]